MFAGHYGVALALKGADKRVSLGTLFVAVMLADILFVVLVLLGVEKIEIVPGITAASPLNLLYYPFSHSLTASIVWAAVACAACR